MPIKGSRFHTSFLEKANHSNSEYLKRLDTAQRDLLFNEALDIVIERLVTRAETDSEVRNHLRQLEKKRVELVKSDSNEEFDVFSYPVGFYKRLRQEAIASKECCQNYNRNLIVRVFNTDEINEARKNTNWKPSWDYEQTFADEGEGGLYVWHDGEFNIDKVYIDYIRKPKEIQAPSFESCGYYINSDGEQVSNDVDFEIDSTYLYRKIVDIAVVLAMRNNNEINNFQSQVETIMFKEKL